MMFNKYLVITGEDCDVHDPDRLAALLRRAEFPRDLIVSEGVYDVLDHATVTSGFGGKLAFDLTEIDPSAPAEAVRVPERFELTPGLVEVADGLAGKWGALLLFADDAVEQKPDLAAFLARKSVPRDSLCRSFRRTRPDDAPGRAAVARRSQYRSPAGCGVPRRCAVRGCPEQAARNCGQPFAFSQCGDFAARGRSEGGRTLGGVWFG